MDSPIDLTSESDDDPMRPTSPSSPSPDLILLIYVHGFKGTDVTFESFPERLEYLVQQTIPNVRCTSRVFPVYETRGSLSEATERFVDWLTYLTIQQENEHAALGIGGAGKAKILLCGHSMGGLLIADAALTIKDHTVDKKGPLWPRVVGVIGFDSPYLGLSPGVFKNSISKYASHVETAKTVFGAIAPTVGGLGGLGASFGFGAGPSGGSGSDTDVPGADEGPDEDARKGTSSGEVKEGGAKAGKGAWGFGGWNKSVPSSEGPPRPAASNSGTNQDTSQAGPSRPTPPAPSPRSTASEPSASSRWWNPSLPTLPNVPKSTLATLGAISALTAAAAGTVYYKRQDLAMGWGWVSDHLLYVSNLWDVGGMKGRGKGLLDLVEQGEGMADGVQDDGGDEAMEGEKQDSHHRIVYRNFYTEIPPEPPNFLLSRTFCVQPSLTHPLRPYWRPVTSSFVDDEVSAHIGMFNAKTNEAFYPMGLEVARVVVEAVERARALDVDI